MKYGHRGITLAELMIAIAVLGLVLALLGYPIFSAIGYVKKATARSEAQQQGKKAADKLAHDLGLAMYIFEVPPDGSWVSFVIEPKGQEEDSALSKSMGIPMSATDADHPATLVRYGQVLNYPWQQDGALIYPNYLADIASAEVSQAQVYERFYGPYHSQNARGGGENPYLLTRFMKQLPWDAIWGTSTATAVALDSLYPMDQYPTGTRSYLLRRFRNDMQAVTPYGEEWDVPHFQVTPLRVTTEGLAMLTDAAGRKNPTVFLSRYPLWAGRNRDLDDVDPVHLPALYGSADYSVLNALLSPAYVFGGTRYPLYPVFQPALYARHTNPFGYQVRVFDQQGGLLYGLQALAGKQYTMLVLQRHFMDWPPIARPDVTSANPLWTARALDEWKQDVERQRMEGKVSFAQPMRADRLTVTRVTIAGTEYPSAYLPIPTGWEEKDTYLVAAPPRLVVGDDVFKLVDKAPEQLGPNEFALRYAVKGFTQNSRGERIDPRDFPLDAADPDTYWQRMSREIVFADATQSKLTATGVVTLQPFRHTICDLQPTDVVVATYSTKAVLDVALTVSRQDSAGRTPAQSRQDASFSQRIEARNAIKRARGNQ